VEEVGVWAAEAFYGIAKALSQVKPINLVICENSLLSQNTFYKIFKTHYITKITDFSLGLTLAVSSVRSVSETVS